jgi:glycogen debranching enzyme
MTDPWNFPGESPALPQSGGLVTLVQGSAFSISERTGDMLPGLPQGLFFRDTRFLSSFRITVNGQMPEALAADTTDPYAAAFVARIRPRPGVFDSTLMVFRHRWIGRGMREDITIRNFGDEAAFCAVELIFEADFADLFEVKEGRVHRHGEHTLDAKSGDLVFQHRRGGLKRAARLSFSQPSQLNGNQADFEIIVPPRGEWTVCVQLTPIIDDEEIEPRWKCGEPIERAAPAERMAKWRREIPNVETDHEPLGWVIKRSAEDLGALRIFDPDYPERAVMAAGAPWFMTLFGRDSLITSWMALIVDPDLAMGTLQTLARFQGEQVDPRTEEEPGRILHEMRFGESSSLSLGGGRRYYGSADATPLFVMLLGELRRWGLAREAVDELLPHADRALQWIEDFGDRDGDGYVEYQRASDRGLLNQGWKDSHDAIRYANGEVAKPPIALAEIQGYVYNAYLARAHFAMEVGDEAVHRRYSQKALDLRTAFNRDFWLDDRGYIALGLDAEKKPIDSVTSNPGHCLWTGILDEDKGRAVAERIMSDELFTGWGVRTLSRSNPGYNPISYHCGSVWPHDSAIAAAGLMRYGYVEDAQRVMMGLIDAGVAQGGRLPELFAGIDRSELPMVVSYPTSCSPQAWAAASPLLFLRTFLRLNPQLPSGKVWLSPAIPDEIGRLRVDRIPLAGRRVTVEVENGNVKVEGLPSDVEIVAEPRGPLTAV